MNNEMKSNGYFCTFHMPDALKGEDLNGLPPYAPQSTYSVDDYPTCPENWMKSDEKLSSYFVGVEEDKGMWLDFNQNRLNEHHTAILISIQGINPVTGLKQSEPCLERYEECCPKHGCKFEKNRHCPECGYQWPMQNYLSSYATPSGHLWLDGFRTIEGQIRQYIFTKEKMRGVASNIIGADRVFAIGISFFKSKEKNNLFSAKERIFSKSVNHEAYLGQKIQWGNSVFPEIKCIKPSMNYHHSHGILRSSLSIAGNDNTTCGGAPEAAIDYSSARSIIENEKIEIGAGAKIKQSVYNCDKPLSFWEDEPCAQICINYTHQDIVNKILKAGKKDWNPNKDGFMTGIPAGN